MGNCESVVRTRSENVHEEDTTVSMRQARQMQKLWRYRVRSPVVKGLAFADGKVLADYFVFLRDTNPQLIVELWKLSLSRFGLFWTHEEAVSCRAIASVLEPSWAAYLRSPHGFGNYTDTSLWSLNVLHIDESDEPADNLGGTVIDQQHLMYEFAVASMMGIHVACVSYRTMAETMARAPWDHLKSLWYGTFPCMSLIGCLQNTVFSYMIPPQGTAYSPPTQLLTGGRLNKPYVIEDYCPELFSRIRQLSEVADADYYASVCRIDIELIEFSSNSKSGAIFFFSHDRKFMLKTATKEEATSLLQMLPDMCRRFNSSPNSLLGRYCGLYRVRGEALEYNLLFFVMRNATQHRYPIAKSFDLKGSTRNRRSKPDDPVGKDVNFLEEFGGLNLSPQLASELLQTHHQDVEILRQHEVMDYSLLVQVHDRQASAVCPKLYPSVPVRMGHSPVPQDSPWSVRVATASASSQHPNRAATGGVQWRAYDGITSADGRFLYTFALIDILVPYAWWSKAQVLKNEIQSCGRSEEFSRIQFDDYADRQIEFMKRVVGPPVREKVDT